MVTNMAYKKKFKNYKFEKNARKGATTPDSDLEVNKPKNSGAPSPKETQVDMSFQRKAFKDIAFGSYSVPVNPQGEVSYEADPYAVVNRTNVIVDAAYLGSDNTAGKVVPQLALGASSTFNDVTDVVDLTLDINYNYCSFENESDQTEDHTADAHVNKYMLEPWNDILETIIGEAFTDLEFFRWNVYTAPSGTEETTTPPSGDGLLDLILSYQAVCQQVLLIPQTYRTLRSLETHLKDMCYMHGSSRLNDMFGMIKKSAFVNAIKTVSESMMYHYVDTKWWRQVNMLISVPCRKSNSMIDPLICVTPRYKINPNLYVYDRNGASLFNTGGNMNNIINICHELTMLMNPYVVVRMARNDNTEHGDIAAWFNSIVEKCGQLVTMLDTFNSDFKEMIVAFKRMAKVGITEWQYGQYISVDKIDNAYQPKFNKLVYDIIRSTATGSEHVKYNLTLNQWEISTLWDLFLGIPSYDYKSGGSILTFSSHQAEKPVGTPSTISYAALYNVATSPYFLRCLTRSNYEYTVTVHDLELDTSTEMRRLMPLSSYTDIDFKAPVINMTGTLYQGVRPTSVSYYNADPATAPGNVMSWGLFALAKIFGYCRQIKTRTGAGPDYTYTYNDNIETDALCFVDVVIDDQSNAIQSFCRKHAPFRTVKADLNDYIGFSTGKTDKIVKR